MRLLVDARSLLPVQPGLGPTGVGRWTAGTITGLAAAAPEWDIELVLIHSSGSIDPTRYGPNVRFRPVRFSDRWQRRLSVAGLWPKIDRLVGPADALLGPAFVTWRSDGAEIPVIHDLTHVKHPEFVSPRNLSYMRLMLRRTLPRARLVVTVSEAMRAEIATHYDLDPQRVAVVPNGHHPAAAAAAAARPLPIGYPEEFLLFVGTREPRKNLVGTLAAYEIARESLGERMPPLVLVGGRGWRDEAIDEALARAPKGTVIPAGYVDDGVLLSLYAHARALLFPSLYEGFGLPVLEAMAVGCPVVTSAVGGLPEVAGDAALYVDPSDPRDIAAAIERLLTGEGLARELGAKGRAQARRFTWASAGQALREAIERARDLS